MRTGRFVHGSLVFGVVVELVRLVRTKHFRLTAEDTQDAVALSKDDVVVQGFQQNFRRIHRVDRSALERLADERFGVVVVIDRRENQPLDERARLPVGYES